MRKNKKKYIPLDEDFKKRSMSDVLFAHIQINSYQDKNGVWFCYKPRSFFREARDKLGFKKVDTIKTKYNRLLSKGFLMEGTVTDLSGKPINVIIIPTKENFYEKVDVDILKRLALAPYECSIKVYAYLLNKYRVYTEGRYVFTYGELITKCLGCKTKDSLSNLNFIKKILILLVEWGLIKYKTTKQGKTFRKELTFVSTKIPFSENAQI